MKLCVFLTTVMFFIAAHQMMAMPADEINLAEEGLIAITRANFAVEYKGEGSGEEVTVNDETNPIDFSGLISNQGWKSE